MNSFYKDSHILFKDLAKKIAGKEILSEIDTIQNTLLFALGIEKLLKGMLYDINPVFILENADFKNAFPVYHKARIIKANQNSKDIHQEPNGDVIAFQHSVLRATLFSQAAFDSKNTLMKLKNARDIIVHNSFDKLKISELKLFLNRDFYVILKAFSDELKWGAIHCFNNLDSKLALIASSLEDDINKKIGLKLEASRSSWKVSKNQNIQRRKERTLLLLQNEFAYPATCPACSNRAVVFTKPIIEYNPFLKQEIQVGLNILKLQCAFCGIDVADYKELDILKITPDVQNKIEILERNEVLAPKESEAAAKGVAVLPDNSDANIEDKPIEPTESNSEDFNKPDRVASDRKGEGHE